MSQNIHTELLNLSQRDKQENLMRQLVDSEINTVIKYITNVLKNGHVAQIEDYVKLKSISASVFYKKLLLDVIFIAIELSGKEFFKTLEAKKKLTGLQWLLRHNYSANCKTEEPSVVPLDADICESSAAISKVYSASVGRKPAQEETQVWMNNLSNGLGFEEFVNLMFNSDEAKKLSADYTEDFQNGEFIQRLYETVLNRGVLPAELVHWKSLIESGQFSKSDIAEQLLAGELKKSRLPVDVPEHDPNQCIIMGTTKFLSLTDWKAKKKKLKSAGKETAIKPISPSTFQIKKSGNKAVTAIVSLFKGGKFIETFLDNMVEQTIIDDSEIIILDASSPEGEGEIIKRYQKMCPSIHYHRFDTTIGIYEAWNIGAKMAKGKYLTNANVDDKRRDDSFELQAATLDNLAFVDVVYQDFYYTFDPFLSFAEIARFGYKSELPIVTPNNMLVFNSPHNAPMWRRELHQDVGYFDATFKSAGDYEFWLRSLSRGKRFFKLNEPHVAYYQNPEGLSTRPDTRGLEEAHKALYLHSRNLIPGPLAEKSNALCDHLRRELNLNYNNEFLASGKPYEQIQLFLRELRANESSGAGR